MRRTAAAPLWLALLLATQAHAQSCQTIPGTTIKVGATCLPRAAYPKLKNPVNPLTYGADPTGATNSAPAFQQAANTGRDIHVACPKTMATCTYSISDAGNRFSVHITTGLNVQCDANVTLFDPDHDREDTGMLYFSGVTSGGVQGCAMIGANLGPPPLDIVVAEEGNVLVHIEDSTNMIVEGNSFGNSWADAAIELSTADKGPGVTATTLRFNTFTANPLYGAAITSGGDDRIENNLITDSETGVESNHGEAMTGRILIARNLEIYQYGGCHARGRKDCNFGIGFTGGGTVDGFKGHRYPYYRTNQVTRNYCTGSGRENAEIYDIWNKYISPPPHYHANMLGTGCTCASGAKAC